MNFGILVFWYEFSFIELFWIICIKFIADVLLCILISFPRLITYIYVIRDLYQKLLFESQEINLMLGHCLLIK